MPRTVRALVVTVPATDRELAAYALFRLGAAAVEERDLEGGDVELWTHVGDGPGALAAAAAAFPVRWPWRAVDVDESVSDSWREHVSPTWVNDGLVVVPAWMAAPAVATGTLVVAIDPGAAFGLGDHPTTVLTLRALLRAMARRRAGTVLDVGSGSGVLGIVAAMAGAERVVAIDHHGAAVEATAANADRNGVAERIEASARPLGDVVGDFDLVVANLLAPVLVELAPDLVRRTAPGGTLVVSGVLEARYDHVVDALAPLAVAAVEVQDGWAAVELRTRGG
jgi:ribosomal protein L11 methyltransferase